MSSKRGSDSEPLNGQARDSVSNRSLEVIEHDWEHYQMYKADYPKPNLKRIWEDIVQKIGWQKRVKRVSLIPSFLKYAAAILLPLAGFMLGLYFYSDFSLSPETDTATVITAPGVSIKVDLPDGSEVWLRPNSEITYPKEFDQLKREIHLSGHAYFKTQADSLWPFVVRANGFSTIALGTEFIMKTMPERATIETALVSGRVLIEWIDKNNEPVQQLLEPLERIVYSSDERNIICAALLSPATAKWNHYFMMFEGIPIGDVMKKIADSYNMYLEVEPGLDTGKPITITVREESFDQILSLLQFIVPFDYVISKDTVHISSKHQ